MNLIKNLVAIALISIPIGLKTMAQSEGQCDVGFALSQIVSADQDLGKRLQLPYSFDRKKHGDPIGRAQNSMTVALNYIDSCLPTTEVVEARRLIEEARDLISDSFYSGAQKSIRTARSLLRPISKLVPGYTIGKTCTIGNTWATARSLDVKDNAGDDMAKMLVSGVQLRITGYTLLDSSTYDRPIIDRVLVSAMSWGYPNAAPVLGVVTGERLKVRPEEILSLCHLDQ